MSHVHIKHYTAGTGSDSTVISIVGVYVMSSSDKLSSVNHLPKWKLLKTAVHLPSVTHGEIPKRYRTNNDTQRYSTIEGRRKCCAMLVNREI